MVSGAIHVVDPDNSLQREKTDRSTGPCNQVVVLSANSAIIFLQIFDIKTFISNLFLRSIYPVQASILIVLDLMYLSFHNVILPGGRQK